MREDLLKVHHTVEEALKLDVSVLRRYGALRRVAGWMRWERKGETAAAVEFYIQRDPTRRPELVLVFHVKRGSDRPYLAKQTFPLVSTSPNYGGTRWWFRCVCGRRVAKLYLPPGSTEFLCRHCHEVVYSSQREGKRDRLLRRARKLERRLTTRPDGSLARPRGMHRSTFERIADEIEVLEGEAYFSAIGPLVHGREFTKAVLGESGRLN
jgi:hypothetical protein